MSTIKHHSIVSAGKKCLKCKAKCTLSECKGCHCNFYCKNCIIDVHCVGCMIQLNILNTIVARMIKLLK